MKIAAKTIAVLSHRGGSMKTTLAACLGLALAGQGRRVLLADLAVGGGVFQLEGDLIAAPESRADAAGPLNRRKVHRTLPIEAVHTPDLPTMAGSARIRMVEAWRDRFDAIILDAPMASRESLVEVSALLDLAVLTLPSDVVAVRSFQRFLELVHELRAMPGRGFRTVLVPTGTGRRTAEHVAIDRFTNNVLAPLSAGATLPWDDALAAQVAAGRFPEPGTMSPTVASNMNLLAQSVSLPPLAEVPAGR